MRSAIVVDPAFDGYWPFAADALEDRWSAEGPVTFVRLETPWTEAGIANRLDEPASVDRLVSFGVPVTESDLRVLSSLAEATVTDTNGFPEQDSVERLREAGVDIRNPRETEGYWSESVTEFGLGLTISALRRIPQLHQRMAEDRSVWDYTPPSDPPRPGERGGQFGDTTAFTSGPIAGKRVRIVGVGNIGSRYASACDALGADVAAHDPFADEPCFHRSGAARERFFDELVGDAEIFAPLVPLTDGTRGLVDRNRVEMLPEGCLVVLVTRARVVDTDALRERVLADELALAADVWDDNPGEPVPLDDPLLDRPNVVHTPHVAGRTRHANERFAEMLAEQFRPR